MAMASQFPGWLDLVKQLELQPDDLERAAGIDGYRNITDNPQRILMYLSHYFSQWIIDTYEHKKPGTGFDNLIYWKPGARNYYDALLRLGAVNKFKAFELTYKNFRREQENAEETADRRGLPV